MGRRGRRAGIATATAIVGLCLSASPAQAGVYGDLSLRWTGTTTTWSDYPSRDSQSTYSPCNGAERLVGIGAWVIESVPTVATYSEFKIGKAYVVSNHPTNQVPGAPTPDSNHEVTDNLFKNNNRSLQMGESTMCAEGPVEPTYESAKTDSPGKHRTGVKAKCTPGSHVISGGGAAPGPLRSQRLVESAPWDSGDPGNEPDDGWRVAVDNLRRKDRTAEAFAICGEVEDITYETVKFDAAKRERKHVALFCPVGEYVLGGGIAHDVPFGKAALVASRHGDGPSPEEWITELDNLTRQKADGRTYAICHT